VECKEEDMWQRGTYTMTKKERGGGEDDDYK
jgi:hypothetical protein